MLWHNAPKSKRVGQKSLVASTTLAVISFNESSLSYSVLIKELGIQPSYNSIIYLARRDRIRNQSRTRRIFETHKRRRRQIIAHTKLAESSRKRRDKASYTSGKFGSEVILPATNQTICAPNDNRRNPRILAGVSTSRGSVAICAKTGITIAVKVSRLKDNYHNITSVVNASVELIVSVIEFSVCV